MIVDDVYFCAEAAWPLGVFPRVPPSRYKTLKVVQVELVTMVTSSSTSLTGT